MRVIIRGFKNAFRNALRTVSVTLILALSIGLALIMLLSYQTVEIKIASVKASVGNTITVNPAGSRGFEGGGEPLTLDQVTAIKGLADVTSVNATLQDRMTAGTDNNLVSAIDAGTLGNRFGGGAGGRRPGAETGTSSSAPTTLQSRTIPIMVTGVSDPSSVIAGDVKVTSGDVFAANSSENAALVGTALAAKNNLSVGSTFTAYNTAITVKGIFDAGNEFANAGFYMPLTTLQTLSDQANAITGITVTSSSIETVDSVSSAIKNALGADAVDVTSNKTQAESSLAPLENIKNISLYSLIGALVAGAVITLLIMMMIVRERRREIGVLKAIGSSNMGIVTQFVSESLVFTVLASGIGAVLGVLLSNPVLNVLVNNSASTVTTTARTGFRGGPAFAVVGGGIRSAVTNLHATVGWQIILYGFLAAIAIAIIGSALPAWLIAKIKPAEVMRAE